MKLVSFLTDLHGDEQCNYTVEAALKSVAKEKPDIRIFGGDLCDIRFLRRGCSEEEKYARLDVDIGAGIELLKRYRPHYWLLGNHDDRLWQNRDHPNSVISYACNRMIEEFTKVAKSLGTRIVPYHIDNTADEESEAGCLRIGNVTFIHGYECSDAGLRREASEYGTNTVVQGHVHRECVIPQGNHTLYSVPALTHRFHEWNSHRPAFRKHRKGWAYVLLSDQPNGWSRVSICSEVAKRRFLAPSMKKSNLITV